jgi:hypothetical protein
VDGVGCVGAGEAEGFHAEGVGEGAHGGFGCCGGWV